MLFDPDEEKPLEQICHEVFERQSPSTQAFFRQQAEARGVPLTDLLLYCIGWFIERFEEDAELRAEVLTRAAVRVAPYGKDLPDTPPDGGPHGSHRRAL